jgi:dimethylamine/trimethylamine dehydrogenase
MPILGASAANSKVFTPEQIMVEAKSIEGDRVVIFDCDGYFMGVALAERLANEGKIVTIVSAAGSIAATTFLTEEGPGIYRRLIELGVAMETGYVLDSYQDGVARAHGTLLSSDSREWEADGLVLVTQRFSEDALYRELRDLESEMREAGILSLWRIGDCVAPRLVADAIFDGHRLAREIDSPNPGVAMPFLIEGEFTSGLSRPALGP